MEQKIDVGVDWRMRVATPISFMEFFVGIIPIGRGIKRRTLNEIVIQTQGGNKACNGQVDSTFLLFWFYKWESILYWSRSQNFATDISFTRFLPTVIAASAVFTACKLLFNDQYYREKENMIRRVTKYVDEVPSQNKSTYCISTGFFTLWVAKLLDKCWFLWCFRRILKLA